MLGSKYFEANQLLFHFNRFHWQRLETAQTIGRLHHRPLAPLLAKPTSFAMRRMASHSSSAALISKAIGACSKRSGTTEGREKAYGTKGPVDMVMLS